MNPNEYWLRELVEYLLEQARYEREVVTMDAIDREKLEEYFDCPFGDIDIEKIALSEWEQVKQWNNDPRGGAMYRAERLDKFTLYVIGLALGNNSPDANPNVVNTMFEAEKERQQRLFRENIDKYREQGRSP